MAKNLYGFLEILVALVKICLYCGDVAILRGLQIWTRVHYWHTIGCMLAIAWEWNGILVGWSANFEDSWSNWIPPNPSTTNYFGLRQFWRTWYIGVEWILLMMLWVNNLSLHMIMVGIKSFDWVSLEYSLSYVYHPLWVSVFTSNFLCMSMLDILIQE